MKIFKKLAKLLSIIKNKKIYIIDRNFCNDPKITPHGFKFAGNKSMVEKSMVEGNFEILETEVIKKILPFTDVVINVGANIGYYCCLALQYKKKVVAFEPIEINNKYLLDNIRANGWDENIEVFPIALANKVGIIDIFGSGVMASIIPGWDGKNKFDAKLVPCNTLDNVLKGRFLDRKILFIIDIEGAEKSMLDGASSYLAMDPKPIWLIEITTFQYQPTGISTNPSISATFQLFWSLGYESFALTDKGFEKIEKEQLTTIANSGKPGFPKYYPVNFLFIEEKSMANIF